MKNFETYQPANLQGYPDFSPAILHGKDLLLIPSQGEHNTKVIVGQEGEMRYEQRQAGEITRPEPGAFVSRVALPSAEEIYLQQLFGDQNPQWYIPERILDGIPLDQIILRDPVFLNKLGELVAGRSLDLYGFSQTSEMSEIAATLGARYYGNPEFAAWAGTKAGLIDFAAECGVKTPLTVSIQSPSELPEAAAILLAGGYTNAVVKANHSTGAMGQKFLSLKEIPGLPNGSDLNKFLPAAFMASEGAVVQGWITKAKAVSLSTFVDFDCSYTFTGAQMQLMSNETPPASSGAVPIDERHLASVLEVGHKIAAGYVAHKAYGPHGMDMLIPDLEICEQLGLKFGEPLCHDENTRTSATMISRAWMLAITEGRFGVGWKDAKIKLPTGTKIGDVIETLRQHNLLLTQTGAEESGVFVYNGAVLDYGHEDACYALAISGNDDPAEAVALIDQAVNCLGGNLVGVSE